jgi:alanine racemase
MSRPLHAYIATAALLANVRRARQAAPGAKVIAVVKADGYGHGIVETARALSSAGGSDALAVACLEEALILRGAGLRQPIILLEGFFQADELPLLVEHELETVIHSPHQIEQFCQARLTRRVPLWLKIDTGMHRLGLAPEMAASAWQTLRACPWAGPLRLMTHLACADEPEQEMTARQLRVFGEAVAVCPGERSMANSAGILAWPQARGEWIRPGIMLYGASPFAGQNGWELDLQPVMHLRSALIAVKTCKRGGTVGYGATWICPEDMRLGVVAAGYGDGYPRHAPPGTPVLVNGQRVPLIGRVSMDMLTVDLRTQPQAAPGDPVLLWGDGLPVDEIARYAGTIGYELLTRISRRVRRVYSEI